MIQELKQLKISALRSNPYNFRKNFNDSDFDELVVSIRKKGVIQPVLARPINGKKKFEIVFGERRFRAAGIVAKEKGGNKTIPALVRKLTDSEAYDLMIIENIQRKDLSELDEAQGFKLYLDKNGSESLLDLAVRTGLNAAYIRRRVSVMKLPEPVLKAWGEDKIKYGYLEQLARLENEKEIMDLFEDIMEGWQITSIRDLKSTIDDQSVSLDQALFDLKKERCLTCNSNSDVQLKLFEIDTDGTKCMDPACFLAKQKMWLTENWSKTDYHKKYKTRGYKFMDDVDRQRCDFFHDKKMVGKECLKCDGFVTVFSGLKMQVFGDRVCVGESSCFKKTCSKARQSDIKGDEAKDGGKGQGNQPRIAWHGEYFREIFFNDKIPQQLESFPANDLTVIQLALFSLIKSNDGLMGWFLEKYSNKDTDEFYYPDSKDVFDVLSKMDINQASEALKAASQKTILFDIFGADSRRLVAEHIGIDLSKEWVFTNDYLQKKTISEMLGMGERFGIFKDLKATDYLSDTIGKKSFTACKKKELISVFLESGVDLAEKVPEEIIN